MSAVCTVRGPLPGVIIGERCTCGHVNLVHDDDGCAMCALRAIVPADPPSDHWQRRLPPSLDDFDTLGRYNAERSRGIVHDPEWVERMAQIQEHFDAEQRALHADGFTIIPERRWWRP